MADIDPIYTPDNVRAAFQLNWSASVFWALPAPVEEWIDELKPATEKDGVRILEHTWQDDRTTQFLVSTRPDVRPSRILWSIKGRLQHHLQKTRPNAFTRNSCLRSIGSANRQDVESYVGDQLGHHQMADPRVQEDLTRFQLHDPQVDLSQMRQTNHGLYIHNLHLVLVNDHRWHEVESEALERTHRAIVLTARKKGHLLSRMGVFADHVHLCLGAGIEESPEQIALGYMNNVAFLHGMRPVLQSGYYAGTFGDYNLDAVRHNLADKSSPPPTQGRG